ncbi:MAG: hypothetical protein ABI425_00100 [Patescibacteria group bacterium]
MPDIYVSLASKIIKDQEAVIGPLAWSEAGKVKGIKVIDHTVEISGDGKQTLGKLVSQYEGLFGRASVEVCRDAIRKLIVDVDPKELPDILLQ